MTDIEKLALLKSMTGEADEDILSAYLALAGDKVCRRAYPYDSTIQVVPDQYSYVQVEIAVYLLNKRGAEGESLHSENGISRTYENGDIPLTLLRQITPFASVMGDSDNEDP